MFHFSIIGRTCAFALKKSILTVEVFRISCYDKSSKKFFKNVDFTLQPPAFLIEIISRKQLQES